MRLFEEARHCRLEAKRMAGKPEAPFLLHLAEAFEELAVKDRQPSNHPPKPIAIEPRA